MAMETAKGARAVKRARLKGYRPPTLFDGVLPQFDERRKGWIDSRTGVKSEYKLPFVLNAAVKAYAEKKRITKVMAVQVLAMSGLLQDGRIDESVEPIGVRMKFHGRESYKETLLAKKGESGENAEVGMIVTFPVEASNGFFHYRNDIDPTARINTIITVFVLKGLKIAGEMPQDFVLEVAQPVNIRAWRKAA